MLNILVFSYGWLFGILKIKTLNLEKGSEILSNFNNIFKKKSFKIQIGEYGNVYEKLNDIKANDAMTK